MKRAAITGAAGLIGSHCARKLLAKGVEVVGFDNFHTGSLENLRDMQDQPGFTFHQGDLAVTESLEKTLDGCDVIIHLAALKIPFGPLKATDVMRVNLHLTERMLDMALKIGARLVFASTSDVYGKGTALPFQEDADLVLGPSTVQRWSYAASKIFDEHLCLAYHREQGLPVAIVRYFNAYGPGHDVTMVSGGPQALFIEAILDGKPVTLLGGGGQQRCFCYVEDTADGTILAAESPNAIGEIFNIGNGDTEITIRGLAELVQELIRPGEPLKADIIPHAQVMGKGFEEVSRRVPDLTKSREILGFQPRFSNREGLEKTIAWHKERRRR